LLGEVECIPIKTPLKKRLSSLLDAFKAMLHIFLFPKDAEEYLYLAITFFEDAMHPYRYELILDE
jgi:hypothetical protein